MAGEASAAHCWFRALETEISIARFGHRAVRGPVLTFLTYPSFLNFHMAYRFPLCSLVSYSGVLRCPSQLSLFSLTVHSNSRKLVFFLMSFYFFITHLLSF